MHRGRRVEGLRRHVADALDLGERADRDGREAPVAGTGGEPRRDLALDEDDRARWRDIRLDQAHQHESGELVRKVAGGQPPGGEAEGRRIDDARIRLEHGDVGIRRAG